MICVLISLQGFGQGLLPVGVQNPGLVIASAAEGSKLYAICVDTKNVYGLWEWSDHILTNHGNISDFPAHGTNDDGEFAVKDAILYKAELYILGDYYINTSGSQSDLVYKWDGTSWSDVSNSIVRESSGLTKFVIYKNDLHLVGVFEKDNTNLLKLKEGSTWEPVGDWLTINRQKDYIIDAYVHGDNIYASGRFTKKVGADPYRTGMFNGENWTSISHPPFLHNSYVFGAHNDELVLTGSPNNNSDFIKAFNGSGWDNISEGLENYNLKAFSDVISHKGKLYVSGDFEDVTDGIKFNLLVMTSDGWDAVKWPYQSNAFTFAKNNEGLFIIGEFNLYGIQNFASISSGDAVIMGRIYEDNDGNCSYTQGENIVQNQVLIMNPGNHVFWTDAEGYYRIPASLGSHTLTLPPMVKYSNACDTKLDVEITQSGNYPTSGFGLKLKENVVDLKVKSGFNNGYTLIAGSTHKGEFRISNEGTVSIVSAEFSLSTGSIWNNVSFNPDFDREENGKLIWEIKNLGVGDDVLIEMEGLLKNKLSGTDLTLTYDAKVLSPESDINPSDNNRALTFKEGTNLDPIYKECGNGRYFQEENPLNYYIRFTNVGNAVVEKVVLRDSIDEDIVISTKGIEYYTSHDVKFDFSFVEKDGKYLYVLYWVFDQIDLPDSSSGATNNVGYIEMNIALAKGFHPSGTMVCNKAEVFFDKQEPYQTNEVCSEARNVSAQPPIGIYGVTIYPNPSSEAFTIKNSENEEYPFEIFNTNGQLITENTLQARDQHLISTTGWAKGIYYIKINGVDSRKLVVQ